MSNDSRPQYGRSKKVALTRYLLLYLSQLLPGQMDRPYSWAVYMLHTHTPHALHSDHAHGLNIPHALLGYMALYCYQVSFYLRLKYTSRPSMAMDGRQHSKNFILLIYFFIVLRNSCLYLKTSKWSSRKHDSYGRQY